jgi:hypothetical protein
MYIYFKYVVKIYYRDNLNRHNKFSKPISPQT